MQHTSSTPSLRLRAMEPEDLDALYQIENDMQLWQVGATNVPYSRFALHEYMTSVTNDIYTDKQLRLMVENDGGELVGMADLVNFDPRHLRAEVGIVIRKPYRRRGYATATLERLITYAQTVLHLHQLYAVVASDNLPAVGLFRKSGFHQSGELADWLAQGGGNYVSAIVMQYFLQKS